MVFCVQTLLESTKLHELLRQPFDMFRPGYTDTFIMGLVNQLAQVMDEGVTDQVHIHNNNLKLQINFGRSVSVVCSQKWNGRFTQNVFLSLPIQR